MRGSAGEILYIGKAKVLRSRVRSYFIKSHKDHRAANLLAPLVEEIDWIITKTEIEALQLEARMVQRELPPLNVRLKDGKRYPYLKVTVQEPFPRVVEVRKVVDDGSRYFGPYPDSRSMRRVVALIQKVFKIRSCSMKLPSKKEERPCLSYHMGWCGAPCLSQVTPEEYGRGVKLALQLLGGRSSKIIDSLKLEMRQAADLKSFEKAAIIRDQIDAIQSLGESDSIEWSGCKSDLDVMVIRRYGDFALLLILEYREGAMADRRQIEFVAPLVESKNELLLPALVAMGPRNTARLILLEEEPAERPLLEEWLHQKQGHRVRLAVPQRGKRLQMVKTAIENAEAVIEQSIKRWEIEKSITSPLVELQQLLKLKSLPIRIVCFDVSHLGGTNTVASMVYFENGRPKKSGYRKFILREVDEVDDYASMREVVTRWAHPLKENKNRLPDLMVIDGGEGQLSSVCSVLKKQGLDGLIPVIGIAEKKEEIVLPKGQGRIILERNNSAQKLIQQIRDEAHRFAITFQKKRREKSLELLEELADLPGFSPSVRMGIFKKLGGLEELKQLSYEEMAKALKPHRARILYRALHPEE